MLVQSQLKVNLETAADRVLERQWCCVILAAGEGDMKKQKLDLDLGLPSDDGACEVCVRRLLDMVRAMRGILEAHVDTFDAAHAKLRLHYDRTSVRLEDIQTRVERAGAKLKVRRVRGHRERTAHASLRKECIVAET